mmetsp:Transcript_55366/g.132079  ORF Transcript_55366/g.132079 Transcript_55366/m.132079 type:complete len:350 (+) Transcript_55366:84-1133(+)
MGTREHLTGAQASALSAASSRIFASLPPSPASHRWLPDWECGGRCRRLPVGQRFDYGRNLGQHLHRLCWDATRRGHASDSRLDQRCNLWNQRGCHRHRFHGVSDVLRRVHDLLSNHFLLLYNHLRWWAALDIQSDLIQQLLDIDDSLHYFGHINSEVQVVQGTQDLGIVMTGNDTRHSCRYLRVVDVHRFQALQGRKDLGMAEVHTSELCKNSLSNGSDINLREDALYGSHHLVCHLSCAQLRDADSTNGVQDWSKLSLHSANRSQYGAQVNIRYSDLVHRSKNLRLSRLNAAPEELRNFGIVRGVQLDLLDSLQDLFVVRTWSTLSDYVTNVVIVNVQPDTTYSPQYF